MLQCVWKLTEGWSTKQNCIKIHMYSHWVDYMLIHIYIYIYSSSVRLLNLSFMNLFLRLTMDWELRQLECVIAFDNHTQLCGIDRQRVVMWPISTNRTRALFTVNEDWIVNTYMFCFCFCFFGLVCCCCFLFVCLFCWFTVLPVHLLLKNLPILISLSRSNYACFKLLPARSKFKLQLEVYI